MGQRKPIEDVPVVTDDDGETVPAHGCGDAAAVIRVIADVVARRARGEVLPDAQVIAERPELMPELAEELEGLRMVQRAFAAGQKAGPIRSPLAAIPLDELHAPIVPGTDLGHDDEGVDADPRCLSIPGYQIYREIGTGGQGTVYKAIQDSTRKTVAIKVLPGGPLAGSHNRGRFDREADILATLDHPNVVAIVDRGCTAGGSFFLVMPFVEGQPLDEYAADRRAEGAEGMDRLARVFCKLAGAVAEAHAREIVHRDLKPSNVLVDARDEPHLLDFGLARLVPDAGRDWGVRSITVAGQVVGSLPWASPEQVSGASSEADPRSDVYSLGVCLHQCLTGEHPYPLHGSIPELIERIRFAEPPRVGVVPGLGGAAIGRVAERCLSKHPEDRYPTAGELAADLAAAVGGEALAMMPRRRRPAAIRRLRRAILAISLVVATAVGWYAWPRGGGGPARVPVHVLKLPADRNTIGMRLLRVPRGSGMIGTPDNAALLADGERSHLVEISRPFWIAEAEVSRSEYFEVMGELAPGSEPGPLPVTGISWEQASEFCRRLGEREGCTYRLPTEVEWEYACRAGSGTAWSGSGDADDMGWTASNSNGHVHPVGQKQRNHWGLHDMHGNAAEWCLDGFAPAYPEERVDPLGVDPAGRHAVRGGSYARPPAESRSAARRGEAAGAAPADVGFRVVRVEPTASTQPISGRVD